MFTYKMSAHVNVRSALHAFTSMAMAHDLADGSNGVDPLDSHGAAASTRSWRAVMDARGRARLCWASSERASGRAGQQQDQTRTDEQDSDSRRRWMNPRLPVPGRMRSRMLTSDEEVEDVVGWRAGWQRVRKGTKKSPLLLLRDPEVCQGRMKEAG